MPKEIFMRIPASLARCTGIGIEALGLSSTLHFILINEMLLALYKAHERIENCCTEPFRSMGSSHRARRCSWNIRTSILRLANRELLGLQRAVNSARDRRHAIYSTVLIRIPMLGFVGRRIAAGEEGRRSPSLISCTPPLAFGVCAPPYYIFIQA